MKTFCRVSIYISVLSLSFGIHQMATSRSKILAMQDSPQVLFTFSDSTGKLLITLGSESVGHTPEFKAIESKGKQPVWNTLKEENRNRKILVG